MNVSNISATQAASQGVRSTTDKRADLQMAILRKALEAQRDQSAQLMRQMEGKGQILDIRV